MNWVKPLVIIGVVVVLGAIPLFMLVNYNNTEVDLRNQCKAQQKANEAVYDEVWKVLSQRAGVLDKYAQDFKEVYVNLMNARYEGKDPMMNWIHEHNPNLDPALYKDLSIEISAQRAKFTTVQKRLIDIKREHDNLRQKIPSCFFVGGRPELDIKVVTSSKTEKTFASQKEDDIELFNK